MRCASYPCGALVLCFFPPRSAHHCPRFPHPVQTEKSSFLDLFYDDFIEQLVATLVAGCKTGKEAEDVVTKHVVGRPMGSKSIPVKLPVEESLITAETLNHICELLTFCVQHHSFRIK
jgi:protein phosphatase-4 regulatory subunit 3